MVLELALIDVFEYNIVAEMHRNGRYNLDSDFESELVLYRKLVDLYQKLVELHLKRHYFQYKSSFLI